MATAVAPTSTAIYHMPESCRLIMPEPPRARWEQPAPPPPSPVHPVPVPHAELVTVSPSMAQALLDHAWPNRHLSQARVLQMAQDMASGRWASNGETLVLDHDGRLLDGRHRLEAVLLADIPIRFLVVRDVDADARWSIDQGKTRTTHDHLTLHQVAHAQELASAGKWLYRLLHGMERSHTIPLRPVDLPRFLAEHPELQPQVLPARGLRPLLPMGLGIALLSLFHGKEPRLALRFTEQLKSGLELRQHDPAHALRERLLSLRQGYAKHPTQVLAAALAILSWNAARRGQSVKHLAWKGTQDQSVPFPEIT